MQYRTASPVTFVETAVFTPRLVRLGLEAPFRLLQLLLWQDPEAGAPDPGTGRTIYFLWIYGKHEQDTLSSQQKAVLRALAGRIRAEAGGP